MYLGPQRLPQVPIPFQGNPALCAEQPTPQPLIKTGKPNSPSPDDISKDLEDQVVEFFGSEQKAVEFIGNAIILAGIAATAKKGQRLYAGATGAGSILAAQAAQSVTGANELEGLSGMLKRLVISIVGGVGGAGLTGAVIKKSPDGLRALKDAFNSLKKPSTVKTSPTPNEATTNDAIEHFLTPYKAGLTKHEAAPYNAMYQAVSEIVERFFPDDTPQEKPIFTPEDIEAMPQIKAGEAMTIMQDKQGYTGNLVYCRGVLIQFPENNTQVLGHLESNKEDGGIEALKNELTTCFDSLSDEQKPTCFNSHIISTGDMSDLGRGAEFAAKNVVTFLEQIIPSDKKTTDIACLSYLEGIIVDPKGVYVCSHNKKKVVQIIDEKGTMIPYSPEELKDIKRGMFGGGGNGVVNVHIATIETGAVEAKKVTAGAVSVGTKTEAVTAAEASAAEAQNSTLQIAMTEAGYTGTKTGTATAAEASAVEVKKSTLQTAAEAGSTGMKTGAATAAEASSTNAKMDIFTTGTAPAFDLKDLVTGVITGVATALGNNKDKKDKKEGPFFPPIM